MEIKGKILQIGEVKQISDKFKLQPILIETEGQYPKTVQLQLVRKAIEQIQYLQGGEVKTFSFDSESREFNGKYYTNLNCFEIS
jgi:hypothetical protein